MVGLIGQFAAWCVRMKHYPSFNSSWYANWSTLIFFWFKSFIHSKSNSIFEYANFSEIWLERQLGKFEWILRQNKNSWTLIIPDHGVSLERQYLWQQGTNKLTCWQIHLLRQFDVLQFINYSTKAKTLGKYLTWLCSIPNFSIAE